MKLITRQILANEVVQRWKEQYPNDKDDIRKKLEALGDIKNPDDIDHIIGNGSWTRVPCCSECGKDNLELVIMVGEEPDYDADTAWLCADCIRALYFQLCIVETIPKNQKTN